MIFAKRDNKIVINVVVSHKKGKLQKLFSRGGANTFSEYDEILEAYEIPQKYLMEWRASRVLELDLMKKVKKELLTLCCMCCQTQAANEK